MNENIKLTNSNLMGLREYARYRGVTLRAVQKAIETERITTILFKGKNKIDPLLADLEWDENSQLKPENFSDTVVKNRFNQARADRTYYLAKMAEINYKKQTKSLIEAEKVMSYMNKIHSKAKDRLLQLPEKLSTRLANTNDPIKVEELILEELNLCINEFSNGSFLDD